MYVYNLLCLQVIVGEIEWCLARIQFSCSERSTKKGKLSPLLEGRVRLAQLASQIEVTISASTFITSFCIIFFLTQIFIRCTNCFLWKTGFFMSCYIIFFSSQTFIFVWILSNLPMLVLWDKKASGNLVWLQNMERNELRTFWL